MIDPENEDLVPVNRVPRTVEKWTGKFHCVSTIYRWMNDGVRGVKLEWVQAPGYRCTSIQALKRFLERLTRDSQDGPDGQAGALAPVAPRPIPSPIGARVKAQRKVEHAVRNVLGAIGSPDASAVAH